VGVGVLNLASNQGRIGPGGNDTHVLLGSGTAATINILCRIKSGDGGNAACVLFRYSNAGSVSGYRAGFFGSNIVVDKYVSGVRSNIGSTNVSYVTGEEWWLRVVASSTSITVKAWKDGNAEPGSPQVNLTDSSITSAGQYGISVFMSNDFTYFDSLVVTDNQSATQATRDISSRLRILAQNTRDLATRFRLFATSTRDMPTRLRLFATQAKDTTTRLRLLASSIRDISSRARLSALRAQDVATRLILQAGATLKDVSTRIRLSVSQTGNISARMRLFATTARDLSLRLRLATANTRDVRGRVRLLALLRRDISARFRLAAGTGSVIQDISMRMCLIAPTHATMTLYAPRGTMTLAAPRGTITLEGV
jgi:hypothetical protein